MDDFPRVFQSRHRDDEFIILFGPNEDDESPGIRIKGRDVEFQDGYFVDLDGRGWGRRIL